VAEGGGANVVNVILVDYRGYDTMGEITVLGIAGVVIYALLAGFVPARRPRPPSAEPRSQFLPLVARLLLPMAVLVSLYLFLRGHNAPGGGFIAGLVLALALILQYVANGRAWGRAAAAHRLPRLDRRRTADRRGGGRGQLAVRRAVPDQHLRILDGSAAGRAAAGQCGGVRPRRLPHGGRRDHAGPGVDWSPRSRGRRSGAVTIELLLAIGLGVLTAAGVWLLLRARVFDIIVG